MIWLVGLAVLVAILVILGLVDIFQTRHAIRRNYPVVGRLRYALERIGPELRQYIVTDNDEERPFTRDQRRWVYATSKMENQYFGFGTDNKMDAPQYALIRHSPFPYQKPDRADIAATENGSADDGSADNWAEVAKPVTVGSSGNGSQVDRTELNKESLPSDHEKHHLPAAKIIGEWRNRSGAFRPDSVVNISAMSFGSLSGPAIEALNRGAKRAGCLHNTGEGGVSDHHRNGGDLILQLGTGYFGARTAEGRFDLEAAVALVSADPIKAIEIKLSQGAKPGLGGVLPASKVTAEIALARGVPQGQTVASPAGHVEFDSVSAMIGFVERIADACGVPVGIKSAVGDRRFWVELADAMAASGKGPDFITIDGGEGGTGAAPLVFSDHVSLPFRAGFSEVYRVFAERGMHDRITWAGAGKLGFPGESLVAMALGVDLINVGREAMLAVGCIQAQKCHTGHCPTGVATHNKWLTRGLDPTDKSVRTANYIMSLRYELLQLAHACGQSHPALVGGESIDLLVGGETSVGLWEHFGYDQRWRRPSAEKVTELSAMMA